MIIMYSYNNTTEAISARLAPGLKERIDFECQQHRGWNRNRFINNSCSTMLQIIHELRCGNIKMEELPPVLRRDLHVIL